MKRLTIIAVCLLATVALSVKAQYWNPVIAGYHPDPSICRVGDDFYVVNSSFQYFPGVPIYHSTDLVNWELIGNVLNRQSQLSLRGANSWTGIYAPTLRYHDGTFYLITTNIGGRGNFMVTARDPRGPWSEPVWLRQGGIDPSLYFENDKCYMVSNPDNTIMLCQINPKTGQQLTPSKALWQGTGGRYPEGPHLYKKDGWYYLLISEGGTELAHGLTIARSKQIEGPYEPCPQTPLFTHCSMAAQSSPIQGTGHGDFVQTADGSWWVVFLAYRQFGGSYHHLGRETFLAPVEWKQNEWPVVNGGQPIDTLMITPRPYSSATSHPSAPRHLRTTFSQPLGPEWIYIQNPDSSNYTCVKDRLRLKAGLSSLTENQRPTFVGRRQESPAFSATTRLDFNQSLPGDEAGLTVYQTNDGHADFCLTQGSEGMTVTLKMTLKSVAFVKRSVSIPNTACTLRVRSDGLIYYFDYALDGTTFETLDRIDCALLSTEVVGGFTGVVLGMYAARNRDHVGQGLSYADFSYFDYNENPDIKP